jgi:hypothetical protein
MSLFPKKTTLSLLLKLIVKLLLTDMCWIRNFLNLIVGSSFILAVLTISIEWFSLIIKLIACEANVTSWHLPIKLTVTFWSMEAHLANLYWLCIKAMDDRKTSFIFESLHCCLDSVDGKMMCTWQSETAMRLDQSIQCQLGPTTTWLRHFHRSAFPIYNLFKVYSPDAPIFQSLQSRWSAFWTHFTVE